MAEDDLRTRVQLHKAQSQNTKWLEGPGVWTIYIFIVVGVRILFAGWFNPSLAWTVMNCVHSVATFLAFHWVKGDPYETTHGGFHQKLTLWEQLDGGVQFTSTRKFLMLVPVGIYLLTSHYTNYHAQSLLINTAAFLFVLVPKLPFMNKRRLFGINKD
eukprot:TRINITY_DN27879_c0_g1_i1.p1 TRINITY_DN27879_c0_g1~~TRINITY_DN27879_c0_g1_i1.p1  ORF type:complete len:172 (+),score=26.23 TRINITY_DN27879_c0_g1_i1:44-517(+)